MPDEPQDSENKEMTIAEYEAARKAAGLRNEWDDINEIAQKWANDTVESVRQILTPPQWATKADTPPEEDDNDPEAEGEPKPDPEAEHSNEVADTQETASVNVPNGIRKLILNLQQEIAKAFGQKSLADNKFWNIYNEDDIFEPGFKASGDYWYARWSNSFQDRDGEWFAEKAHEAFAKRVEDGVSEMPELWVEHIPGSRIGQAKVIGGIGHFMIAAGTFDDTVLGRLAKAYYAKHPVKGVSHGFYFDPAHYVDKVFGYYDSFEISPLRKKTPSNAWTTFDKVREMKLTDKDLSILNEMFGEDVVRNEIIAKTEEASKALEVANKRFKTYLEVETTTEAAKTATEKADKNFKDLVLELLSDNAAIAKDYEAVSLKVDQHADALQKQYDAAMKELGEIREELKQRPRASQSKATEVEPSHLSPALQESLKQQQTKIDPFWNTEVTTP